MASVVRSGLCLVTALVVACLPLLPPEHIHPAGTEGRASSLVHAHLADGPDTAGNDGVLTASHGDHSRAIFLTAAYDRTSRFAPGPVALVGAAAMIAPLVRPLGIVHTSPVQRAHGPPLQVWLTRGPPSLS